MILTPIAGAPLAALPGPSKSPGERGVVSLPLALSKGAVALSLPLHLVALGSPRHAGQWDVRAVLEQQDVSAWLTGSVRIEAEEGLARICEIQLLPGAPYTLASVSGKRLTVDLQCESGGAWYRRFTGRVEMPELSSATGVLTLHATDGRRDLLARKTRADLASLLGGHWSDLVFSPDADSLRYAEDRLSTVQASFDLDVYGNPRVTPWRAGPSAFRFDAGVILDQSLQLKTNRLAELFNTVEAKFEFRFPRLNECRHRFTWENSQRLADFFLGKFRYPEKSAVAGAASGTGWTVVNTTYLPSPPQQYFSENGVLYFWKNPFTSTPEADPYCSRAEVDLKWRCAQQITEEIKVVAVAPDSVAAYGTRKKEGSTGQLAVEVDTSGWEKGEATFEGPMPDLDWLPGQGRAQVNVALQCLLAEAAAQIAASHRNATLSFQVPAHSELDVCHTVAVEHPQVDAAGKVQRVVTTLDTGSGRAADEITMVLFGALAVGTVPVDPLPAPKKPDIPQPPMSTTGSGQTTLDVSNTSTATHDGFLGFSDKPSTEDATRASEFRITVPEIPASTRDPLTAPATVSYRVGVPADIITLKRG